MHVIITLPAGNRFHLKLVAYRISYGDFAVLCAKILKTQTEY